MSTYDFNVEYIANVMINRDEYEMENFYKILETIEGKKIKPFKFCKKGCSYVGTFGNRFKVTENDLKKFKKWFDTFNFEKHEKWLDKFLEDPVTEKNIYKSRENDIERWGFDKYKISEILEASKKYIKKHFRTGWLVDCDVNAVVLGEEDGGCLQDSEPRWRILEILEGKSF